MKSRVAMVAATAAAVLVLLFIALLAMSPTQRASSVSFEIVGDVAPHFQGSTLGGDAFDLAEHRGEWVVVNFFASWCVACRVEHPELVEFDRRHADDDVQLVAVMFGDSESAASAFFADLGGDWPALVDSTDSIAVDYGVTAVPETVLIAPTGRVVNKWVGGNGVTADGIDAAIGAAGGG